MSNINCKKNANKNSDCTCKAIRNGQKLNLIAVSFANILSENLSIDDISVLSVFLVLVADALAAIATVQDVQCESEPEPEVQVF